MGPIEQQKKAKAPVEKSEEQIALRQHLIGLQTWENVPEGISLDEHKSAYARQVLLKQQRDIQIAANHFAQLPTISVPAVAEGTPVQQVPPAEESFKARRQRQSETRKAQKAHPGATYVTYRMKADCELRDTVKGNSVDPFMAQAQQQNVDQRILRTLCMGYQKNKRGKPANAEEALKKQHDEQFLTDYLSMDLVRRKPHLQNNVEKLLNVPISKDMLSDEYIAKNIWYLKEILGLSTCMDNLRADPINAPFFAQLDPHTMDLISAKCELMAQIAVLVTISSAAQGFDWNNSTYQNREYNLDVPRQMLGDLRQQTEHGMTQFSERLVAIGERHMDRLTDSYRQDSLRDSALLRGYHEQEEANKELGLTGGVSNYSFEDLAKARQMIESHPEAYKASQALVDDLYRRLHHTIDASGINLTESSACQGFMDSNSHLRDAPTQQMIRAALRRQEKLEAERTLLQGQSTSIFDALQHLLRGKRLTSFGAMALDGAPESFTDHVARQVRATTLPPAQPGSCQLTAEEVAEKLKAMEDAVKVSNESFAQPQAKSVSEADKHSTALIRLGIRDSSTQAAKANALLRNNIFQQLPQDYLTFFKSMDQAQVPLAFAATHMETKRLRNSPSAFVVGGGMEALSGQLLQMFAGYLRSEAATAYLKQAFGVYMKADVLEKDPQKVMEFVMQSLLNSAGANFTAIAMAPEGTFAHAETTKKVGKEACRTILALPTLLRMDDAERSELSPEMAELLRNYASLVGEMRRIVEEAPST